MHKLTSKKWKNSLLVKKKSFIGLATGITSTANHYFILKLSTTMFGQALTLFIFSILNFQSFTNSEEIKIPVCPSSHQTAFDKGAQCCGSHLDELEVRYSLGPRHI
jgi:hypothetical protein